MTTRWTGTASADLARLYEHLRPVAPDAAARVVGELARAPDRLIEFPRIGEKLPAYEPREVRRVIVGDYELRYQIAAETIFILRLWTAARTGVLVRRNSDRPDDGEGSVSIFGRATPVELAFEEVELVKCRIPSLAVR